MAEKFDPYRKWLGIPPEEQPPHHYRLLGIAPFEDDTDVITYAADRQMSHVRKFQAGQHGQFSQQILNELAKARICLLDRAQKIAYDQELQKKIGGERQARTAPVAAPRKAPSSAPVPAPPQAAPPVSSVATMEPPVSTAMAPVAIPVAPQTLEAPATIGTRPTRAATTRVRRKSSPLPLVLGICGLAVVAALAAIVGIVSSGDFGESSDDGSGETETAIADNATSGNGNNGKVERPPLERPASVIDKTNPNRPHRKPPRGTNENDTDGDGQPDKLIIPENPENEVDETGSLPPITREPGGESETDPVMDPPGETGDGDDEPSNEEQSPRTKPDKDPPVGESTGEEDSGEEELKNDPERAAKFAAAIATANEAFAHRDLKESARQLATARQLKAGDEEEKQVAGLMEIQLHQGAFWRLVATGLRKLQPGDEIAFAGDVATFDTAGDGDVAMHVAGSRLSRPVEDVETHYLVAIAERATPRPDAKSRLAIAAFLAFDAAGSQSDREEEARRVLGEAVSLGGRCVALEQLLGEKPEP